MLSLNLCCGADELKTHLQLSGAKYLFTDNGLAGTAIAASKDFRLNVSR